MGVYDLEQYLPKCTVADVQTFLKSIQLPEPDTISLNSSQGEIHQIFVIEWSEETLAKILQTRDIALNVDQSKTSVILRIAGKEVPYIKNENEAAILKWLVAETSIPVPRVIYHDSTTENSLGQEYMMLTFCQGVDGAKLYSKLTDAQMDYVLDQLADHVMQLYLHPFDQVGGMRTATDGQIAPGPVVDETMWTEPEIQKCWPRTIKFQDLNPSSPSGYSDFTKYLTAYMTCYIDAIPKHPSLQSLPYLPHSNIQLLKSFVELINQPEIASVVNDVPYVLSHRDLHFGQLLLDPDTARITAVLDWEFAQVIPFPLWQGSFLWSGDKTVPFSNIVRAEREALRQRWRTQVLRMEKGQKMLGDSIWRNPMQEAAWDVVNYMRCIVEVVPRSVQLTDAKGWWREVVRGLNVLGVGSGSTSPRAARHSMAQNVSEHSIEPPDADSMISAQKDIGEPSSNDDGYTEAIRTILMAGPKQERTGEQNFDQQKARKRISTENDGRRS